MSTASGISPENEAFLRDAVVSGRFDSRESALNEAILRLRQEMAERDERPMDIPLEEWVARLRQWSESHPKVDWPVDDSRESIY